MTWISLGITTGVISAVWALAWLSRRRPVSPVLIPGCDPLMRTFCERIPADGAGVCILGFVTWLVLSSIIGIFIPLVAAPEFFLNASALASALNYSLCVPALFGAYIYLLRAGSDLLDRGTLESLGIHYTPVRIRRIPGVIYHATLIAATLVIQWSAIGSVEKYSLPESPWVSYVAPGERALTALGALNYGLRGVNTWLALGLLGSLASTWWILTQRLRCEEPERWFTSSFSLRPEIRGIGTALLLCGALPPVVTGLQGFSLVRELRDIRGTLRPEAFTESTWLFWVVATLASSAMSFAALHRVSRTASLGVERNEEQGIRAIERSFKPEERGSDYWEARATLRAALERPDSTPWPRGGYFAVIFGVLVQILSVVATLMELADPS